MLQRVSPAPDPSVGSMWIQVPAAASEARLVVVLVVVVVVVVGLSVVSGCAAAAERDGGERETERQRQRERERGSCARLCCWLMSGEGSGRSRDHKGNPGRTVKSSIRVCV